MPSAAVYTQLPSIARPAEVPPTVTFTNLLWMMVCTSLLAQYVMYSFWSPPERWNDISYRCTVFAHTLFFVCVLRNGCTCEENGFGAADNIQYFVSSRSFVVVKKNCANRIQTHAQSNGHIVHIIIVCVVTCTFITPITDNTLFLPLARITKKSPPAALVICQANASFVSV